MSLRLGIDIGGTFTDLVLVDDAGNLTVDKVPSTPPNFARGVIDGLEKLQVEGRDLEFFSHGTTAATNAIIEKKGARTGLITTAGFRDVLEIRRADRGSLYDYWWRPPQPLVPRQLRREARERVAFDGSVLTPLQESDVEEAVTFLKGHVVEAVAICYLNSFANPEHERRTREIVENLWPDDEGDKAHGALRTALHRLRGLLGDPRALIVSDSRVSLDPALVWVDLFAFDRLGSPSGGQVLDRAFALYRGPFLPGPLHFVDHLDVADVGLGHDRGEVRQREAAAAEVVRQVDARLHEVLGVQRVVDVPHPVEVAGAQLEEEAAACHRA